MESRITTTSRCQLEQLEQRRMLCGDLSAAHMEPLDASSGPVSAVEQAPIGGEELAGGVIGAFAADARGVRVIWGEQTIIDGSRLVTWALVSPRDDQILAAGVTVPIRLIDNQPQQPGSGPAGAIASLEFPSIVQDTTYFNHFEMHTQPNGHPFNPLAANPNRYRPAHFDFHFYSIPEDQVRAIGPTPPPLPAIPAQLLPAGYRQPGPVELVPQMGRHSGPLGELTNPAPFSEVMIAGFVTSGTQMHFIEPMITREKLLQRQDFTLPVPMPQSLGQETLYPSSFEAVSQGNSYYLIYSGFNESTATLAQPSTGADGTFVARTNPAPIGFSGEQISSQQSIASTIFGTDDAQQGQDDAWNDSEVLPLVER